MSPFWLFMLHFEKQLSTATCSFLSGYLCCFCVLWSWKKLAKLYGSVELWNLQMARICMEFTHLSHCIVDDFRGYACLHVSCTSLRSIKTRCTSHSGGISQQLLDPVHSPPPVARDEFAVAKQTLLSKSQPDSKPFVFYCSAPVKCLHSFSATVPMWQGNLALPHSVVAYCLHHYLLECHCYHHHLTAHSLDLNHCHHHLYILIRWMVSGYIMSSYLFKHSQKQLKQSNEVRVIHRVLWRVWYLTRLVKCGVRKLLTLR